MISVIIPTRNRAELLRAALLSLSLQTLPPEDFEVLVVDNGSTDHTKKVVNGFNGLMHLRYFFDPTPGLHVGRHRGLREASGEILVYGDDDIEALPTWLEAIAESFVDPSVSMVGGNNIPKFEAAPPVWLKSLWEKPFLDGHAIPFLSVIELPKSTREINPNYVWGCNFSIRKQIVLDAGGFHPDGVPQDSIRFRGDGESCVSSYVERQGLRCIFDHRASVYHLVSKDRMTMEYFKKRAFNQGVSDSYRLLRQQGEVNQLTWKMTDLLMWLKQKAQTLKDITMNRHLSDKQQLEKLFKMIRNGYWEGFWYHRQAYTTDSEVRAWVHQGFYW